MIDVESYIFFISETPKKITFALLFYTPLERGPFNLGPIKLSSIENGPNINIDFFLNDIECISFFTYWDMMVFPGWWTNLKFGKKISVKVYKHRNLVRNESVVNKIIDEIIM